MLRHQTMHDTHAANGTHVHVFTRGDSPVHISHDSHHCVQEMKTTYQITLFPSLRERKQKQHNASTEHRY